MLLWQRSSNLFDIFFVAIPFLLFIELTTPVLSRVACQWRERPSSYNGDHNSSEMAGAPPVGRRSRTTRTTPSKYVRTTLIFGAHSSSRLLVVSVPRQLCHLEHSAPELPRVNPSDLFTPGSASMLHCTSPRAASTSPTIARRPVLLLCFGAAAYARRATDKHTRINPSQDQRRGLRLLRKPIGLQTHLLTEPDRPSQNPLGLRAPCSRCSCRGSLLVVLPGKEQAVLVECGGF